MNTIRGNDEGIWEIANQLSRSESRSLNNKWKGSFVVCAIGLRGKFSILIDYLTAVASCRTKQTLPTTIPLTFKTLNPKKGGTWRIAVLAMTWVFLTTFLSVGCSAANVVEVARGIAIDGTIVPGDYQKFENILLKRKAAKNPVRVVGLASNGGDIRTALQIGRLIRLNWIVTGTKGIEMNGTRMCNEDDGSPRLMEGGPSCTCDSACFLVWVAGVERSSYGTILGLHRPYFGSALAGALSDPDVGVAFQKVTSDVRDYLREMNVPDHYFDIMMNKSSVEIYRLSEEEVKPLYYSPLAEEAIIKTCGTVWDKDPVWLKAWSEMFERSYAKLTTSRSPTLDKLLDAPMNEMIQCTENVILAAQDRLQNR